MVSSGCRGCACLFYVYCLSLLCLVLLPSPLSALLNLLGSNLLGFSNKAPSVYLPVGWNNAWVPSDGGMWGIVSRAAERMCPVWHKHRIYGAEVSLHLWTRDEKIPLSCPQTPSLPRVYPCTPISSLLDPSCISFQWADIGSHRVITKQQ